MAAMLAGRELGLPPMTSLRHVQVVEGSPGLSAEYKRARVLSAGHKLDVGEHTTEACQITGHRKGHQAPLPSGSPSPTRAAPDWSRTGARGQTRPRRMLFARACTEVCDALFADVTNGLPTAELLDQDDDGVSGYDEQPARPTGRVTAAEITARHSAPQNASPAVRQVAPVPADPHSPPAEPAGEAPTSGPAPSGHPARNELAAGPDDTDYDSRGTVITPQLTAIWTLLTSVYGFTKDEKDQARAVCGHILGGELASTKDMSKNEARKVLDTLAEWRAAADEQDPYVAPREYLARVLADGGRDA